MRRQVDLDTQKETWPWDKLSLIDSIVANRDK